MICIYHSADLDGLCSGAILHKRYPKARMIGYDYGQPVPFDIPDEGLDEDVIMADVSFPIEVLLNVADKVKSFTWIDHHVSAYKEYVSWQVVNGTPVIHILYSSHQSACELTWEYCFSERMMPSAVVLLGEYDTWRKSDEFRWNTIIMPFQYGMRVKCNSLETFPVDLLSTTYEIAPKVVKVMDEGKVILKYQDMMNEKACRDGAFEVLFEGCWAICLNTNLANSQVFESIYDPEKHQLMMPFSFKKDKWTVSLYTTLDTVDCSVLAKKHGGGGHRKAAGFQVMDIRSVFPNVMITYK